MKKALLVVSFGTSYAETREKNITACEQHLHTICPDRELFRAFTSNMILRKLEKRDGLLIDNPQQALKKLKEQGVEDVAIQSLHIVNGEESEKIVQEVEAFRNDFKKISIGKPLLSSRSDYDAVIRALQAQMPTLAVDERLVLMGHGATHHAFSAYACLDHMLRTLQLPIVLGSVESYPEIEVVLARLQTERVRKVHLMPFMIVAGDHAINDMASDEEDAWNRILRDAGFETQCYLQGLGENPEIRALFAAHLLQSLEEE